MVPPIYGGNKPPISVNLPARVITRFTAAVFTRGDTERREDPALARLITTPSGFSTPISARGAGFDGDFEVPVQFVNDTQSLASAAAAC
jgi:hypothetical protein